MIAAKQSIFSHYNFCTVAELWLAFGLNTQLREQPKSAVPGESAKADDDAQASEQPSFFDEVAETRVALFRTGFVGWRGTTNTGADITVIESKSIATVSRGGLIGKSGTKECGIEPVA